MADRKLEKWQIAFLATVILIIPFIIVFQLTKADIVINIDEDFKNQCFFGQPVCVYDKRINVTIEDTQREPLIAFRETENNWQIIGDNVFCIKIEGAFAEPVTDPVGVVTKESEVNCNNIAVFDKDEWDLQIRLLFPDSEGNLFFPFSSFQPPEGSVNRFTFTMKQISEQPPQMNMIGG